MLALCTRKSKDNFGRSWNASDRQVFYFFFSNTEHLSCLMLRASLDFGSAGCNQAPGSLCTLPTRRKCFYSSGPSIVVAETVESENSVTVSAILPTRRKARVGCLSALDIASAREILVFAALSDGSIAIARGSSTEPAGRMQWSLTTCSEKSFHSSQPVVSVSAASASDSKRAYLASIGMDCDLKVSEMCIGGSTVECLGSNRDRWQHDDHFPLAVLHTEHLQSATFLPECVAITLVNAKIFIAVGGTDRVIRLFSCSSDGNMARVAALSGHQDWIRSLVFSTPSEVQSNREVRLASGSADGTIRVWRFNKVLNTNTDLNAEKPDISSASNGDRRLDSLVNTLDTELDDDESVVSRFKAFDDTWLAAQEGVLCEHTDAVNTVSFSQGQSDLALLSSSMDGSVALWFSTVNSGIVSWSAVTRFGMLGGSGTFVIGFAGASFLSPDSRTVLGHSLGGSLHLWRRIHTAVGEKGEVDCNVSIKFVEEAAPTGHFASVTDVAWDPSGRFVLTCSEDKTVRIYAKDASGKFVTECARPQVHGHAVRSVAFLSYNGSSYVSASDEKVLRLFDSPAQFSLPRSCPLRASLSGKNSENKHSPRESMKQMTAMSAFVPELGLSNKPVFIQGSQTSDSDDFQPLEYRQPAFAVRDNEGTAKRSTDLDDPAMSLYGAQRSSTNALLDIDLRQRTLWPERAKLYGHGNDVNCVSCHLSLGVIASACKAQNSRDASIIIWDCLLGTEIARLSGHELTVNQLRFSVSGEALLSVSRDRSFAVFSCRPVSGQTRANRLEFNLIGRQVEAHSRLIHSGCWLFGTEYAATGSRDKTMKIFRVSTSLKAAEDRYPTMHDSFVEVFCEKFSAGVSALDAVCDPYNRSCYLMAVGLENGSIQAFRVSAVDQDADKVLVSQCLLMDPNAQCSGSISRVSWNLANGNEVHSSSIQQPNRLSQTSVSALTLAVSSDDNSVRILRISQEQA